MVRKTDKYGPINTNINRNSMVYVQKKYFQPFELQQNVFDGEFFFPSRWRQCPTTSEIQEHSLYLPHSSSFVFFNVFIKNIITAILPSEFWVLQKHCSVPPNLLKKHSNIYNPLKYVPSVFQAQIVPSDTSKRKQEYVIMSFRTCSSVYASFPLL